MNRNIIVFDYETDSIKAGTDHCNPVEIAAVAIHGKKLEIIENSEFYVCVKPDCIDDEDYYKDHKSTIDWHARLHPDWTAESVMDRWRNGMAEKAAHKKFIDYVAQYNYTGKAFTAPVPAGTNIRNFDLKIYDYLNKKHGTKNVFSKRDRVDLQDLFLYWFSYHNEPPKNFKMDTARAYFGMSTDNAHNALIDVQQEAALILKFMALHKRITNQVTFKGSLKGN